MTNARKIELISGVLTGVLAVVVSVTYLVPRYGLDFFEVGLYLAPALLVSVGAYIHTLRGRSSGRILLLVGGLLLTALLIVLTLGGALIYFYGVRGGLFILSPGPFALLTILVSSRREQ